MKLMFIFLGFFLLPLASYGQVDPDGYAVICNDTCTIMLPDEKGNATPVTVGKGYVLNRIKLTSGQSITVPPNESVVADPDNAMTIGKVDAAIPDNATNSAGPAIAVDPVLVDPTPVNPVTP